MNIKFIEVLLCVFYVHVFAFDDVSSEIFSSEMMEEGKNQYQLLEERGRLPQYGDCWKSAVEHIHEGCRYLTEDIQSDLALRITNCFLEMSGHETYHCDHDKKQNLRRICISSMSDRAFNVYTEFYTHAQNICWFLRGQMWQEKITERAYQVGEQLKSSVSQQELLLKQQNESLIMQEQILNYGKSLEKVLNESRFQAESVMDEIRASTVKHHQLLSVMTNSLSGLQSWLIGEISWFDSLVFYISAAIIIIIITSTTRTASARLPLLIVLSFNIVLERLVCNRMQYNTNLSQVNIVQEDLHRYIWWCRQFTISVSVLIISLQAHFYRDYVAYNTSLLLKIQEENTAIVRKLDKLIQSNSKANLDTKYNIVRENSCSRNSVDTDIIHPVIHSNKPLISDTISENSISTSSTVNTPTDMSYSYTNRYIHGRSNVSTQRETSDSFKMVDECTNDSDDSGHVTGSMRRYNLRRR